MSTHRSYASARAELVRLLGEAAATHDVAAIAGELITYDVQKDNDGNYLGNTETFTVVICDPDRFWDIVARH